MQADHDGGSNGTSVIIAFTLRLALINNDPYVWLQASSNAVQNTEML